ncbi:MAG TPA: M20/M25/M40 family metallo-hydrolase [Candidatus Sulfotelmatobacter sp.]|nr:M20/M25/M40 family metallo-hydrolase [Candidatus Sulfotelmatobacter sp.]
MKIVALIVFAISACCVPLLAQSTRAASLAHEWRKAHESEVVQQLTTLLSIPNVANDHENIQRNADFLVSLLQKSGVESRLLTIQGANPVVFGELRSPNARHTIVFYAHYDGQPVTPSEWENNAPFTPVIRKVDGEDRIFARSASDDKGAIMAQLAALDALRAADLPFRSNIRFVWEGEEEAGSPHLESILNAYRDLVHGDVWLVCDGPVDQSGKQTVVFGARGDTHLEITVFGAIRGLHSGHYGNWAPNSAMMLAQLLAGMKDRDGNVLIPHFYDGIAPLGPLEKRAIAEAPVNDDALRQELGLGHVEGGGRKLLELLNLPTLNINGMAAANVGARANNVIPSRAVADLDLRLVVGEHWQEQQKRVIDYIRSQGYFVVDSEPGHDLLLAHPRVAMVKGDDFSYDAVRTPMDLPIAEEVVAAVESARGKVVKWPTMGGSVPLGAMERAANTHTITVPIANHDNNQHSCNENIRLQNLWDGIETMAAIMQME